MQVSVYDRPNIASIVHPGKVACTPYYMYISTVIIQQACTRTHVCIFYLMLTNCKYCTLHCTSMMCVIIAFAFGRQVAAHAEDFTLQCFCNLQVMCSHSQEDNILGDYCDGTQFKSHPLRLTPMLCRSSSTLMSWCVMPLAHIPKLTN